MPAAAAQLASARPFAEPQAASAFAPVLERIRQRLGISFASIHLLGGSRLALECTAGATPASLAHDTAFCRYVLAIHHPVVVPDARLDPRFTKHALVIGGEVGFYAGVPLRAASGHPIGVLSLFDSAPRSPATAKRLADLAAEVVAIAPAPPAQELVALQSQLDAQARLIQEQSTALAHSRRIFERAAATARIGVWECDLATEELSWTDGVYDIFEFPRGAPIDRARTLLCYAEPSRQMLEKLRADAVERGIGFTLDAEITTAKGNRRWMRLTTSVETENGVSTRIFGMKQDITEEKILADRTRYLAEFDVMTGLANRSRFQAQLGNPDAEIGALLLIDLDGFKGVNDTYGHAFGDECLKETALRLEAVGLEADLVARIGGDEFALLLGPHIDPDATQALAARIVAILGRPVERSGQILQLGASVGIAYGRAGLSPDHLFKQADAALYAAKAGGRNTFRLFSATEG